ncbi:hypothetical protein HG536_0G01610 [Torulaspora globosa]|uniref:Mitochondrial thiamine pyrophosphate carrier 1 n=1 Tax=Torulaspora globosa TaxID=48254 RepID=A0A7G3ZLB6_9SACH|nr:uncharacterized protein HG536_0G01610 [Torulaspora globosa]QLL34302.1 hypothetical protein HG536_0G01610 [Torulaspora globosa]
MDHRDHLRKGEDAKLLASLLSGSASGLVARFATAPMDTVKIRLQITPKGDPLHGSAGVVAVARQIACREGLRGLWKGNVPGSLLYVVYGGVQFSTYSLYNKTLSPLRWSDQLHSLVVGALAGMSSSLASYPFDVLRTRLVANRSAELSTLRAAARQICAEDGWRGLFKGCVSSIATITLATSVLFCTYETVKIFAERCGPGWEASALGAAASPLAGVVSKLATFPLDTARRRMLLSNAQHLAHHSAVYKSYRRRTLLAVAAHIARREGVPALYQGLSMALIKSVPSTAISLWAYQWLMSLAGG